MLLFLVYLVLVCCLLGPVSVLVLPLSLRAQRAIQTAALRMPDSAPPRASRDVQMGAPTRQMTAAIGLAEMAGLATLAIGRQLDHDRERVLIVVSLGLVAFGSLLPLLGWFSLFAAGFFITLLGANLCTVSGHTYLSRRVTFARRARAIGLFETSWALALLIGAPTIAVLISHFGWLSSPVDPISVQKLAGASMVALGAVLVGGFDDDAVAAALDLADGHRATALLCIGNT